MRVVATHPVRGRPAVRVILLLLLALAPLPLECKGRGHKKRKQRSSAPPPGRASSRLPPSSVLQHADYGLRPEPELADLPQLSRLPVHSTDPTAGGAAAAALGTSLRRAGHLRVSGLLSQDEAAAFRPAVISTALRLAHECETECHSTGDPLDDKCRGCERTAATPAHAEKSFVKARNLHRHSAAVAKLVSSPRVAALASAALGGKTVRLYQDTAFFKEPGDMESSWHQDSAATPLDTDRFVTVWLALDPWPIGVGGGALTFASGSHRAKQPPSLRKIPLAQRVQSMRHMSDADITAAGWNISTDLRPGFTFTPKAAKLRPDDAMLGGDASVHLGWTYHRAGTNMGSTPRCAIAISYFADGTKFHSDVLHLGAASDSVRGVEFELEDGTRIVAQLLSDDIGTWVPWLLARELVPGAPARPSAAPLMRI